MKFKVQLTDMALPLLLIFNLVISDTIYKNTTIICINFIVITVEIIVIIIIIVFPE